jgi:NMD protein affecting ribosome stability and mRNA decay
MKLIEKYRPPIKCRWFGHKWCDTDIEINVFGGIWISTLQFCKKCKGSRYHMPGGWNMYTPKATEEYLKEREKRQMIERNETGNVVAFREPE